MVVGAITDIGLHAAWHRAQDRNAWSRSCADSAMPQSAWGPLLMMTTRQFGRDVYAKNQCQTLFEF